MQASAPAGYPYSVDRSGARRNLSEGTRATSKEQEKPLVAKPFSIYTHWQFKEKR